MGKSRAKYKKNVYGETVLAEEVGAPEKTAPKAVKKTRRLAQAVASSGKLPARQSDSAALVATAEQTVVGSVPEEVGAMVVVPAAEQTTKAPSRKRPQVGGSDRRKKKARAEGSEEVHPEALEVEDRSASADSTEYSLNLEFESHRQLIDNTRASADLFSRFPCSSEHAFPNPQDLSQFDAYRRVAGSITEMATNLNWLTLRYERKVGKLEKKVEEQRTEAEKVPVLTGRVSQLTTRIGVLSNSLGESNKVAEERRLKVRELEEQLEQERALKDSLQTFHNAEVNRLRASRATEVRQVVEAGREKLGRIKSSIADTEEVNRISGLMSQAQAIKEYLIRMEKEEGIAVPESRLKALDNDFEKLGAKLDVLEVEEVGDEDFVIETPPWLAARQPPSEARAQLDQYGSQMSLRERADEAGEIEAVLGGQDQGQDSADPEVEAMDQATGERLTPLDGLPVMPALDAQPTD